MKARRSARFSSIRWSHALRLPQKHGVSFQGHQGPLYEPPRRRVEASRRGALDWICTIEPYGTALLNDVRARTSSPDGTDNLRQGLYRLRAGLPLRPDQAESRRTQGPHQRHDEGAGECRNQAGGNPHPIGRRPITKTSLENARIAMGKQPRGSTRAARPSSSSTAPTRWWRWVTQEEARPRRDRLDPARTGHRREQGALRQSQYKSG